MITMALVNFGKATIKNNSYDILLKKQYLVVNSKESNDSEWDRSFDLKDEKYFGNLVALKGNKVYGVPKNTSKNELFNRYVDNYLSIFKYLNISNQDIKKADYTIEKNLKPLLNEKDLSDEFPTDFARKYLADKLKLRKIRIEYNKQFFPTKVFGFYEGTEKQGWYLLRTISYPYRNQKEYDKKLDEYIKVIEGVKEEQGDGG